MFIFNILYFAKYFVKYFACEIVTVYKTFLQSLIDYGVIIDQLQGESFCEKM